MNSNSGKATQRTYIGAYAVILDPRDRLLLCRLSTGCIEAGFWTLPGGGIHWGEPPEQAVLRELLEETGLEGSEVELIQQVFTHVYPETEERPGDPVHHLGLLYRVRKPEGGG